MADFGLIADLRAEVAVPTGGILSRTVHEDERVTLVMFAFDAGQELSEHTSARAALVEILDGTASVVLAGEAVEAGPGTWIAMPPGMRHAIRATTPLVMVLTLLR
ncbi:MAG TPA: cupin domain-containing protein [Candidatus Limnocylindrales bacterium]|nr:cupin domain-containing protein [Candidatus Limnocylindrales bacterium]